MTEYVSGGPIEPLPPAPEPAEDPPARQDSVEALLEGRNGDPEPED